MKKRIVALVSALTLVFAMSINVAAAEGSIKADEVKDEILAVAGEATGFPATKDELENSASAAQKILETKDVVISYTTNLEDVKDLAAAASKEVADNKSVEVKAVFELKSTDGKGKDVTFNLKVNDNQKAYALHKTGGKVVSILGTVTADGKVTFTFDSFSPVAIVIVTEKAATTVNQPPYNPAWDPTVTNANAPAAVADAVAPKTGDVVMMVSIMAIIFMAGAAVAVAMSKKRA